MLKKQKQPTIYEKDEEYKLIEWLQLDLKRQRQTIAKAENILFDKPCTYNGKVYQNETNDDIDEYLKTQIDDKELTLNIGNIDCINKLSQIATEINFEFNFRNILEKLGITEKYEEKNIICPYKLNSCKVTFSFKADFEYSTFNLEANFNNSTFKSGADFEHSTFSNKAHFTGANFTGANFNN